MAQPTVHARIDKLDEELKKVSGYVIALQDRVNNLQAEANAASPALTEAVKKVEEMKASAILVGHQIKGLEDLKGQTVAIADLKTEIAVVKSTDIGFLKKDVEDLKKWQEEVKKRGEEWGRKLWLIVPPILAAALTGFINYLLRG